MLRCWEQYQGPLSHWSLPGYRFQHSVLGSPSPSTTHVCRSIGLLESSYISTSLVTLNCSCNWSFVLFPPTAELLKLLGTWGLWRAGTARVSFIHPWPTSLEAGIPILQASSSQHASDQKNCKSSHYTFQRQILYRIYIGYIVSNQNRVTSMINQSRSTGNKSASFVDNLWLVLLLFKQLIIPRSCQHWEHVLGLATRGRRRSSSSFAAGWQSERKISPAGWRAFEFSQTFIMLHHQHLYLGGMQGAFIETHSYEAK